jgi:hypothetical protein
LRKNELQSTIAEEEEEEEEAAEEEEEGRVDEEEGKGAPMRMESDSSVTWRNLFLLNG